MEIWRTSWSGEIFSQAAGISEIYVFPSNQLWRIFFVESCHFCTLFMSRGVWLLIWKKYFRHGDCDVIVLPELRYSLTPACPCDPDQALWQATELKRIVLEDILQQLGLAMMGPSLSDSQVFFHGARKLHVPVTFLSVAIVAIDDSHVASIEDEWICFP